MVIERWKMVESELGLIPEGWLVGAQNLSQIKNFTFKVMTIFLKNNINY